MRFPDSRPWHATYPFCFSGAFALEDDVYFQFSFNNAFIIQGGKIVGRGQLAVGGKSVFGSRKRSIVRGANGSMLAVKLRSIARFALLEYRFAVEDGGISSWF